MARRCKSIRVKVMRGLTVDEFAILDADNKAILPDRLLAAAETLRTSRRIDLVDYETRIVVRRLEAGRAALRIYKLLGKAGGEIFDA